MANLSGIVKQLNKERDRVEQQLSGLNAVLAAFASVYRGTATPTRKRRKMSAKSRAKMAAGTASPLGEGQSKAEEPIKLFGHAPAIRVLLHPASFALAATEPYGHGIF
jgi:hypothetical protein